MFGLYRISVIGGLSLSFQRIPAGTFGFNNGKWAVETIQ